MNKHHGRDVEEYLKERGIFDKIKELADKKWKELEEEELKNDRCANPDVTREVSPTTCNGSSTDTDDSDEILHI